MNSLALPMVIFASHASTGERDLGLIGREPVAALPRHDGSVRDETGSLLVRGQRNNMPITVGST